MSDDQFEFQREAALESSSLAEFYFNITIDIQVKNKE